MKEKWRDYVALFGFVGLAVLLVGVAIIFVLFVSIGLEQIFGHPFLSLRTREIVLGIGILTITGGAAMFGAAAIVDWVTE